MALKNLLPAASKVLLLPLSGQIVTYEIFNLEDFRGTDVMYSLVLGPLVKILVLHPNNF